MTSNKAGNRFPLLLYQRAAARHRRPVFLLAVLMLALWLFVSGNWVQWPTASHAPWLLAGGSVAFLYWLLTLLAPRFAYVQPREDHLRLRTPLYRLQISYRRLLSIKPINLVKSFPPSTLTRAERQLLGPFMNQPAVGIELRSYPMKPWLLRLFFHRFFFSPESTGIVIIVNDWMKLSEQLSDRYERWRGHDRDEAHRSAFSDAARILAADPPSEE
ncbi:MAG: hypothetical protein ACLFWD_07015 [Anaerolineales bacterium]